MTADARFWAEVDRRGADECWPWTGHVVRSGYGSFKTDDGRMPGAHRVAYELAVAPIPPGLTLDHLCRNKVCVNPAHLEPVTHRENVLRGESVTAQNARKTHCKRGHEFSEENTGYVQRARFAPQRFCRTCRSEARRRWPSAKGRPSLAPVGASQRRDQ